MRDLTRYRTALVPGRVREVHRVPGVLERANIHLASVVSDIPGISGRALVAALIAGKADPATMADLAKRRMRHKIPELEQALTGVVRAHHRRLRAMQLAYIDFLDEQITALSEAITTGLAELSRSEAPCPMGLPAPSESRSQSGDLPALLTCNRAGELRDTIPGGEQRGAERIGAEIGIDLARFATASRLAAWARVAPGNEERAGKQRSGTTRKGKQTLRPD